MVNREWQGKLTKLDAIRLVEQMANHEDPYWIDLVLDFYDEETDTAPSIFHMYDALGVTKEEYKEAFPGANVDSIWPNT